MNPLQLMQLIDNLSKADLAGMIEALKKLDAGSKTLLARFMIRAAKSGDASRFVKEHLSPILDESNAYTGANPHGGEKLGSGR